MSNIVHGTYISYWDDGRTEVHTDVLVDLDEMRVVEWQNETKRYEGYIPDDDGELELLDGEEIIVDGGLTYEAKSNEALGDYARMGVEPYDVWGNGIITYN